MLQSDKLQKSNGQMWRSRDRSQQWTHSWNCISWQSSGPQTFCHALAY